MRFTFRLMDAAEGEHGNVKAAEATRTVQPGHQDRASWTAFAQPSASVTEAQQRRRVQYRKDDRLDRVVIEAVCITDTEWGRRNLPSLTRPHPAVASLPRR